MSIINDNYYHMIYDTYYFFREFVLEVKIHTNYFFLINNCKFHFIIFAFILLYNYVMTKTFALELSDNEDSTRLISENELRL